MGNQYFNFTFYEEKMKAAFIIFVLCSLLGLCLFLQNRCRKPVETWLNKLFIIMLYTKQNKFIMRPLVTTTWLKIRRRIKKQKERRWLKILRAMSVKCIVVVVIAVVVIALVSLNFVVHSED